MELVSNGAGCRHFFRRITNVLYPPRCLICQRPGMGELDICLQCYQRLPWNEHGCRQCALPLGHAAPALKCGRCLKKSPCFDSAQSMFRYQADIITLIHQLKFNQHLRYARLLGMMLSQHMERIFTVEKNIPDCLLPVPLHAKRLRQRGFNQSTEVIRELSKSADIPIDTSSLIRCRETLAQSGLSARRRQQNIRGAFELVRTMTVKHVAIVDDVVTTAATVNEIARVLKCSGVERVDIYSIARA